MAGLVNVETHLLAVEVDRTVFEAFGAQSFRQPVEG